MATVSITAAKISAIYPKIARIRTGVANEAITKGQPLYIVAASGKLGVADGNATAKREFAGVALEAASSGQAFSYLEEGFVEGFTLTNVDYGDFVYLSDAQGYADTPGTYRVVVGRCKGVPDGNSLSKVLHIRAAVVEEYYNGGLY
jgi:hypothetical protein